MIHEEGDKGLTDFFYSQIACFGHNWAAPTQYKERERKREMISYRQTSPPNFREVFSLSLQGELPKNIIKNGQKSSNAFLIRRRRRRTINIVSTDFFAAVGNEICQFRKTPDFPNWFLSSSGNGLNIFRAVKSMGKHLDCFFFSFSSFLFFLCGLKSLERNANPLLSHSTLQHKNWIKSSHFFSYTWNVIPRCFFL